MTLKLFISYATRDEIFCDELDTHLALLKRQGFIDTWSARDITAGTDRAQAIGNLHTAEIILLLISPNFIASDYCYDSELSHAIERHQQGKARVVPIIVRPCEWKFAPLDQLQAIPSKPGEGIKSVTQWENRDEAFLAIAQEIRRVAKELKEVRSIPKPTSQRKETIEEIRSRCRQTMISQYNSIRLLNQTEIMVDQLYVDVWLLKRPPQTLQPGLKMWALFDLRNDRLGMGDRDIRADGMEIANQRNRLLILGKPGAGKTTFLKHLAVDCSKEKFQSDLIPVLIELRQIRSRDWKLLDAIAEQLELSPQQTEKLLKQGQLLILMDGLDEVPSSGFRGSVQRQVCELAKKPENAGNRFILTCRTQIITGEMPQGFMAVEVADFTPEQVQRFVENWFCASGLTKNEVEQQWQKFADAINQNPALKELTVTPVLLSLMCWVFEDTGELPTQTTSLYNQGINLLLERWNEWKEIPEWEMGNEVYRALTLDQKKQLLTNIAAWKFENPKNFVLFEQEVLTQQIVKLLKLKKTSDGEAVLRAIEAQHGLLVERADQLWSFSHLTFQEHFIVQWLTQLSSEQLANKIADPQWQERVKQLVKFQPSDKLLKLIKQAIDQFISQNDKNQRFLMWVCQKAESVNSPYKPSALRAFYFTLALVLALALAHDFDFACDLNFDCALDLALDLDFARDLDLDFARDLALARDFDLACDLDLDFAPDLALDLNSKLLDELQQLREQLPQNLCKQDFESFKHWWHKEGQRWTQALRQVMIDHLNIGEDWQLTKFQSQALWQYYDANEFLVELLKEGRVSEEVRQEIEDKLLLPINRL
ncbi:MAG: NACHT domain-containing protein [Leptolyngbya sp. UWPOB_LEPTO1]|uniref:TIR domain-containing protein n=1 Tax=Leptolyngbya sp. UWPOB_LEPTO1 TaxID=2815653 RepID=UPI001ACCEDC3|nr:TIR domain-containing protein [Leptolyngbya sp. UWPOB_LEPTO1]MBN8560690.1 NACHT domain-containing protein [Leptolyngbya sp. UWPOB_LEPTO1]